MFGFVSLATLVKFRFLTCCLIISLCFSNNLRAQTTTITVGGPSPTYTRLALAFNAISAGTFSGAIHVRINGTITETIKATLSAHPAVDSVMIYPISPSLIQGNLNDDLIDLNGADRVFFDGRINRAGAAIGLTLTNTNTGSFANTFCFSNSACFNTLRYLAVRGAGQAVIRFKAASIGTGNADNVIEHSRIYDAVATPINAIYSGGVFSKLNSGNKILNNEIYNFYSTLFHSQGIYLYDYNADWEINGNHFYQTAPRVSSYYTTCIKAVPNTLSYLYKQQILNNFIGGSSDSCGGSMSNISNFVGIDIMAASNTLSAVSNNKIRNLNITGSFRGIQTGYGKILVQHNFVGDSVGTGSILCSTNSQFLAGIYASINDSIRIWDNKIGAITTSCSIACIQAYGVSGLSAVTVTGNIVGSRVTPNSIVSNAAGTSTITGIKQSLTNGIVHRNTVMNMTGNNPSGANCSLLGIINQTGYSHGNTVAYLKSVTQGNSFAACNGITTFEAKENFVHHLEAFTEYYSIMGMYAYNAANNIVSLGFGITTGAQIFGIYGNAGVNAGYFHNTVCLGGVSTTTNISACMWGGNLINSNIFYCARTSTLASPGMNYCVFAGGSALANCFYVFGPGNVVGWSAGINTGTWGIAGAYVNPMFGAVGNNIALSYKPGILLPGTNVYGGFIPSVPLDYYGFLRPNPPTMGAIEKTSCVAIPFTKNALACTSYSVGNQTYSASGVYNQTLTYPGGCDTLLTLHLQIGPPSVTLVSTQATLCAGQTTTLTASGATSYTWLAPTSPTAAVITVSPASTTVYSVVASNSVGCSANHTVQVTVNALPNVMLNGGQICLGNSYTFTPSGGLTYTYVNGGPVVNPVVNTSYTVQGMDANGCVSSANAIVLVDPLPVITINNGSVCLGKTYTLAPTGASTYSFPLGGPFINPITTSTFQVIGTDANGCVGSVIATVAVLPLPTVAVYGGSICAGNSFTLQPVGGVSYIYHNGGPVVSPNVSTSYSISSLHINGCQSATMAVATISVVPLPQMTIASGSSTICAGETIQLLANGAHSYNWSTGASSQGIIVTPPLGMTVYSVSGFDATSGCTGSASLQITADACTGIEEKGLEHARVFPNPSQNFITVYSPAKANLLLSDMNGKLLETKKVERGNSVLVLSEYSPGLYVLIIEGDNFSFRQEIIKQ